MQSQHYIVTPSYSHSITYSHHHTVIALHSYTISPVTQRDSAQPNIALTSLITRSPGPISIHTVTPGVVTIDSHLVSLLLENLSFFWHFYDLLRKTLLQLNADSLLVYRLLHFLNGCLFFSETIASSHHFCHLILQLFVLRFEHAVFWYKRFVLTGELQWGRVHSSWPAQSSQIRVALCHCKTKGTNYQMFTGVFPCLFLHVFLCAKVFSEYELVRHNWHNFCISVIIRKSKRWAPTKSRWYQIRKSLHNKLITVRSEQNRYFSVFVGLQTWSLRVWSCSWSATSAS